MTLEEFSKAFRSAYVDLWKVAIDNDKIGIQKHSIENGMAIHPINYDYSKEEDAVKPVNELNIKVNTAGPDLGGIKLHTLSGEGLRCESSTEGGIMNIRLHGLSLYIIIIEQINIRERCIE